MLNLDYGVNNQEFNLALDGDDYNNNLGQSTDFSSFRKPRNNESPEAVGERATFKSVEEAKKELMGWANTWFRANPGANFDMGIAWNPLPPQRGFSVTRDNVSSDRDIERMINRVAQGREGWISTGRVQNVVMPKKDDERGISRLIPFFVEEGKNFKILRNVPLFTIGTHTDSRGNTRGFTRQDLQSILEAFAANAVSSVPIKLGHVSDSFTGQVADAFGIPAEVIKGESGKGAIRLGEVTALKLNGSLTGDIKVHEKVAGLIEHELLTGLSVELKQGVKSPSGDFPFALSGLALLGAERPALAHLPSLQQATMEHQGYEDDVTAIVGNFTSEPISNTHHFRSGTAQVDPGEASAGEPNEEIWEVPIRDLSRGTFVQATVSAPNEITAKRVALRTVENFLLEATGPLGKILGTLAGIIIGKRLVVGAAKRGGGPVGKINWRMSEDMTSEEIDAFETDVGYQLLCKNQKLTGGKAPTMTQTKKFQVPEGVSEGDWAACVAEKTGEGVEDPEAACREFFRNRGADSDAMSEVREALGLSKWANKTAVLDALKAQGSANHSSGDSNTNYEERIKNLEHRERVSEYTESTVNLKGIAGTPKELAEKLAKVHEVLGEQDAKAMLALWSESSNNFEESNQPRLKSRPRSGSDKSAKDLFEEKVTAYRQANSGTTDPQARIAVSKDDPGLFREYQQEVMLIRNGQDKD